MIMQNEVFEIAMAVTRKYGAYSASWATSLPAMSKDDLVDEILRRLKEVQAALWYSYN